MYKISKFKELLCENIINDIFDMREDGIYNRTVEEKKEIKDLLQQKKEGYENVLIAIDNVPNAFVETKAMIKDSIDAQLKTIEVINGYDNEKFYKTGFCDGINLIVECLVKKT